MLKNAIKIVLGVKNCIPKIWRFFWKKLCTFLVAYVRKNVGKNRAKRFLENSSFLVRVAIYFLVPHEEFKTEKILLPKQHYIDLNFVTICYFFDTIKGHKASLFLP